MEKKTNRFFVLVLLIAVVLSSLCITALADFSDHNEIGEAYREAVEKMTEKGILNGFPDGTFKPGNTLTREQGAKIVVYIVLGDKVNDLECDESPFEDVEKDRWSAPCIKWCADREILLGYGDGRFGPHDLLTGDQFAKMLMCALEIAREGNYVGLGSAWTQAVREDAKLYGLYSGDLTMMTNYDITREQAALLAYNAIKAKVAVESGEILTPMQPDIDDHIIPVPVEPKDPVLPEDSSTETGDGTEADTEYTTDTGGREDDEISGYMDENGDIVLPEIPSP